MGSRVVVQESLLVDLDKRFRDVKVGPDNHIYLLMDHQSGKLLRLQPGRPRESQLVRVAKKRRQAYDASGAVDFPMESEDTVKDADTEELAKGRQAFLELCSSCHRIGEIVARGRGWSRSRGRLWSSDGAS